jgi:hypothetical protein
MSMSQYNLRVMLLLCGFYAIVGIFTMVVLRRYIYNGGAPTRTIWGFYNTKTKQWHAPINSKQIGDVININHTSPYTSMPLNLNPLEYALYA